MYSNLLLDGFSGLGRRKVLMNGAIRKVLNLVGYLKTLLRVYMETNVEMLEER